MDNGIGKSILICMYIYYTEQNLFQSTQYASETREMLKGMPYILWVWCNACMAIYMSPVVITERSLDRSEPGFFQDCMNNGHVYTLQRDEETFRVDCAEEEV